MSNSPFTLIKRDYSTLNLKKNPFPYSGVPDTNPTFYIGQNDVLYSIIRTLSTTILTRKSSHIILTGSYGSGKSHTLLYIKEQLKSYIIEEGTKPVVSYISQPGDKMLDIYREFMYDLGLERIQSYAREYVCAVADDLIHSGHIISSISGPITWNDIQQGSILLSDIVPTALLRLNELTEYVDLSKAFINLVYDENVLTAWEWISGEGTPYVKRKAMCLSKNIDEKSVIRAFQAIKTVLGYLMYRPVILLIDEFESIENFQAGAKQNLLNAIRHLVDINDRDLTIIIACAPDVWQSLISEYHAFSERIGNEVCLKPLTVERTMELIQAYLENEILDPNKNLDLFSKDVYLPIYESGMGNSRQILTLCGKLIDYTLDKKYNRITLKSMEDMLRE